MNDYPDNELINMVSENNEDARDILYDKYNYIVSAILKKYMAKSNHLGIDYNELKQEALVGFSDALVNYNQDKEAKLSTFISICVERRINNYIRRMSTIKESINKDTISLDMEIDDKHSLYELIGNSNKNPEVMLIDMENEQKILDDIEIKLSETEKDVLKLMLEGESNESISKALSMDIKQVYNTIARIRAKLK